jgi:hypothetical protein
VVASGRRDGYYPGRISMHWPPPLRVRMPEASKDYTELGQDERPGFWVPALVGLVVFMALLVVATLLGRI